MSQSETTLERVLLRERLVVGAGITLAVALAWIWIVPMARDMHGGMNGPAAWMMAESWDARYAALMFGMWAAMMLGMMLPSAAPAILLYGRVARRSEQSLLKSYVFAGGYLLVWATFSLAATGLQWVLSVSGLLTPMMESNSRWLAGAILLASGIYQWTPIKKTCLAGCRAPAVFISNHFRPGITGALRMGIDHGLFCLGCCWVLMLLLFVGGVMSLNWIAAITVFVLLEKLAPLGAQGGRLSGLLMVLAGGWVLVAA